MTNGREGDLLHHHFSADQFYILPILIVAFAQHLVLFFLSIWSAVVLKNRQLLHSTYKIFMFIIRSSCLRRTPPAAWAFPAAPPATSAINRSSETSTSRNWRGRSSRRRTNRNW